MHVRKQALYSDNTYTRKSQSLGKKRPIHSAGIREIAVPGPMGGCLPPFFFYVCSGIPCLVPGLYLAGGAKLRWCRGCSVGVEVAVVWQREELLSFTIMGV